MGSNFSPKSVFLGRLDSGPKYIFDIIAMIYEIDEIFNHAGLCIFCEEYDGGAYFALSYKTRVLESILPEI